MSIFDNSDRWCPVVSRKSEQTVTSMACSVLYRTPYVQIIMCSLVLRAEIVLASGYMHAFAISPPTYSSVLFAIIIRSNDSIIEYPMAWATADMFGVYGQVWCIVANKAATIVLLLFAYCLFHTNTVLFACRHGHSHDLRHTLFIIHLANICSPHYLLYFRSGYWVISLLTMSSAMLSTGKHH